MRKTTQLGTPLSMFVDFLESVVNNSFLYCTCNDQMFLSVDSEISFNIRQEFYPLKTINVNFFDFLCKLKNHWKVTRFRKLVHSFLILKMSGNEKHSNCILDFLVHSKQFNKFESTIAGHKIVKSFKIFGINSIHHKWGGNWYLV